jgi:predicted RNA-binding Zn-ribbon protein involved in translation (DUF1610 family)
MTRNKLYAILLIACFFGFIYLFYDIKYSENTHFGVCIIKSVTGFPCPSCGITRAVQLLLQGKMFESLAMNPFGILVTLIMTIVPFWILFDIVFKKESFYIAYKKMEKTIRIQWLAAILILLVLLNWIWNIYKGI